MSGIWLLALIVNGVISGIVSSMIAGEKGYSGASPFLLGMFFGQIGLLYYIGMPLSCEKMEEIRDIWKEDLAEELKKYASIGTQSTDTASADAASVDTEPTTQYAISRLQVKSQKENVAYKQPTEVVYSDNMIICSLCGKVQRGDRKVCYQCEASFAEE